MSIVSPPDGLFSEETGIYVPGIRFDPSRTNSVGNNFTGNYMMRGRDWERPSHVEMWDEKGKPMFSLTAGLRIHGGAGRMYDLKSLRLYFRGDYGQSRLEYPIFGGEEPENFNRLQLRSGSQDRYRTRLRDELGPEMIEELNLDAARWRPMNLFLNGEYWGIHHIRDRIDEYHLENVHGVEPENIDRLNRNGILQQGTRDYWQAFQEMLANLDPGNPQHLVEASRWMDLENYQDYISAQIFFANRDWPLNNHWYWRNRATELPPAGDPPHPADGRWRWIIGDLDISMGFFDNHWAYESLGDLIWSGEWPSNVIDPLIAYPQFRRSFINTMLDHMNSIFLPERTLPIVDHAMVLLTPDKAEDNQRWALQETGLTWEAHVERLRTFLRNRPASLRAHINSFFDLHGQTPIRIRIHPVNSGTLRVNRWQPSWEKNPVEGVYLAGNQITISASAAPGYRFAHWEGLSSGVSHEPSLDIDPTEASSLTAHFAPDPDFDWSPHGPEPHRLASAAYEFTEWSPFSPPGTHPPHMIFMQTTPPDPALDVPMEEPWMLPYNLESRSRVVGLDSGGFAFINTSNPQEEGGGYLGTAKLALDTIGVEAATVSFTAGTVLPNERVQAWRLQYRPHPGEEFRDFPGSVEYTRSGIPGSAERFGPLPLPSEMMGRPYAQLRWKYHYIETGTSGPRAKLRLDDIVVEGQSAPPGGWILR